MAVRNLDESNTLFAIEVYMENRSPEEIAKDAVLQINALFSSKHAAPCVCSARLQ